LITGLNKVCELDDWSDPGRVDAMRRILPNHAAAPGYPQGMAHRKHWEYAQLLGGLEALNAIGPEALVLSVGAGHEEPLFFLTNHVRWVFATDIYGKGSFRGGEGGARMIDDPDRFAPYPYNRNRLVTQWMSALDLRYEANTFDVVFSLSSIEHFGTREDIERSLAEMSRVLKPGGVLCVVTECIVNGTDDHWGRGVAVFSPRTLTELADGVPDVELVEPIDFSVSAETLATSYPLRSALQDARKGQVRHPHVVVSEWGREWTSASLFFRKVS
jgi:SAM-dependent methyltransferase